jgi:hypothetical protein
MQTTVDRLELLLNQAEKNHHGVYLGFHGLKRLADVYDLREIWWVVDNCMCGYLVIHAQ